MKKIVLSLLAAAITVSSATAGSLFKQEVVVIEPDCVFRDTEFQLDAFGIGAFYNQGRPGWGGGLGANFFFARYFGIGVEQNLFGREGANSGSYVEWATIGNVFLRYPICGLNTAPYAMVGGGGLYGDGRTGIGVGHVGGGLEVRFTDNIGIFGDARWLYSGEEPRSGVLARTGLRFAF